MKEFLETKSSNKTVSVSWLSFSILHPYDDTSMPVLVQMLESLHISTVGKVVRYLPSFARSSSLGLRAI